MRVNGSRGLARRGARHRVAKRVFDVLMAAVVLLVTLPLTALIVVAIVVESGGPVFYCADRVGFRGRQLRMLKFRKMRKNARGPLLTALDDERLTRVGRFLVQTRLDELPQFWHVLRGEMSLVGPRPEAPMFVRERPDDYEEILLARPGLVGLSQLAFADERRVLNCDDPVGHYLHRVLPQKCALDLLYVRRSTIWLDLRIVLWTVLIVLLRQSVAVNRVTGATSLRRRPRRSEVLSLQPPVQMSGEDGRAVDASAVDT